MKELSNDGLMEVSNLVVKREIIKKIKLLIPEKIKSIMHYIDEKVNAEFSIYCKVNWDENYNAYIMEEEYFIPEQEVSATSIDYKEDESSYNAVIHKHPNGCHHFSSTDEQHINQNFLISILYVDKQFKTGIINLPIPSLDSEAKKYSLRMDLDISLYTIKQDFDFLDQIIKEKIKETSYTYSSYKHTHGKYDPSWRRSRYGSSIYDTEEDNNNIDRKTPSWFQRTYNGGNKRHGEYGRTFDETEEESKSSIESDDDFPILSESHKVFLTNAKPGAFEFQLNGSKDTFNIEELAALILNGISLDFTHINRRMKKKVEKDLRKELEKLKNKKEEQEKEIETLINSSYDLESTITKEFDDDKDENLVLH